MTETLPTQTTESGDDSQHVARAIREACIAAALEGYERAGLAGLCAEGRFEMAIDAIRALDLDAVVLGREG